VTEAEAKQQHREWQLSQAGKPYRPANGTEGMMFENQFCDFCTKQPHPEGHEISDAWSCQIWMDVMTYDLGDPEYPKEWIRDTKGYPTCTAYERDYAEIVKYNDRVIEYRRALNRPLNRLKRRIRNSWIVQKSRAFILFLNIAWRPIHADEGDNFLQTWWKYRISITTAWQVAFGVWK
jgi:hypothetical protein